MNVPKLRFKEFTDEWKNKKLDKTTYIKARIGWKNLKASEYVSFGIPMIAGQHIKQGKILWDKADFITNERYEESPEIQLKINDIIFSKDGSLGNPAIIKNLPQKATINGTMMLIRLNYTNDNVSPNYFYQICTSQYFQKMISLIKSGGTIPHIFQRDIINFSFPIPKTLEEQEKIADFLSTVDKKIENLNATIENLEQQKKGLMQQIFSQKLRFKNENGNDYPQWQKKKLSEIGTIITGTTPSTKHTEYYSDEYLWVTPTDIVEKNITTTNKKLSKLGLQKGRIVPANSILVTCIASIGKNAILRTLGSCNQQINAITPTNNYNVDFIYYLICYKENLLHLYAGTGGMEILNKEQFSKISMLFPCLEEQQKISNILSTFNRKTDNQKAQLEPWKQTKKGLLQQMFI